MWSSVAWQITLGMQINGSVSQHGDLLVQYVHSTVKMTGS